MANLIMRSFNGKQIRHREDGFMSLTDMCQANGKRFGNWYQLQATKEYLEALRGGRYCESSNAHIEVNQGGVADEQGTWGSRQVAIRLAQWLSPQFAIQVDQWVVELMTAGVVTIKQPEPRQLAPIDLVAYSQAIALMHLDKDPILQSLLSQRFAEQLSGQPQITQSTNQVILTVRAGELGYTAAQIGTGSALGVYVAKRVEPAGKSQHGKYPVNVYRQTVELDRVIAGFFEQ